ncbi:phospholipase effector Tle1 domain-containing protein [Lysobacter humi (ex Lee et al. 2017)]
MGSIGRKPEDTMYPASAEHIDSYRIAGEQLDQLRMPVLRRVGDPHDRLYVAAMDGTGNSLHDDAPTQHSVVARIHDQIEKTKPENVASGYVEGTFTQNGLHRLPSRLLDGRFAHSFEDRVETAYYQFCVQAKTWLQEDPQARISVVGLGFSRGAEGVAALERLIAERGIRDPEGAKVDYDREGLATRIRYDSSRPLLVPPGQTPQVAILVDPVATGVKDEDRAMKGSTLTTFQISAQHDRRDLFRSNQHVPLGFSEDRRNLNVVVAGAHSDPAGTYAENGLGVLGHNLVVEAINRTSDRPFLQPMPVPADPSKFMIHRSETGMFGLYGTRGFDRDGVRDTVNDQSPRPGVQHKDPIDPVLDARIERRTGRSDTIEPMPASARAPVDAMLERVFAAYMGHDDRQLAASVDAYGATDAGRAWSQQMRDAANASREPRTSEPELATAAGASEAPAAAAPVLRR